MGFDINWLLGVAFSDSQNRWGVDAYGAIVQTDNGGTTWTCPTTFNDETVHAPWLRDIAFADSSNGWVVGGNGLILHTSDGSVTWRQQESSVTGSLFGVAFVDAQRGWAVGESEDGCFGWRSERWDCGSRGGFL